MLPEREQARSHGEPQSGQQPFQYDAPIATPVAPVTTLRGAQVVVNSRRVVRVLVGVGVVAVAALSVGLLVATVHKNAQIASLHRHGVPVEVTVTDCLGVLSGSGSNAAGYSCRGTFVLDGHRYRDAIPGDTLYGPGTTLRMVADESNPGLLATVAGSESEHPSATGFILPVALLLVLAALLAAVLVRSRKASADYRDREGGV